MKKKPQHNYTPEDELFILAHAGKDMKAQAIADHIGCTKYAIHERVKCLRKKGHVIPTRVYEIGAIRKQNRGNGVIVTERKVAAAKWEYVSRENTKPAKVAPSVKKTNQMRTSKAATPKPAQIAKEVAKRQSLTRSNIRESELIKQGRQKSENRFNPSEVKISPVQQGKVLTLVSTSPVKTYKYL